MTPQDSPLECALEVLLTSDPKEKAAAALRAATSLRASAPLARFSRPPNLPDRPARPGAPALVPPGQAPKRRLGDVKGRIALLHALAHIELNAIDLAFDMLARFSADISRAGLDAERFALDWAEIGAEEGSHFGMLSDRLADLGAAYGDLPAHDGLWQAALATRDDPLARLAVAPMSLEARGLDVTPAMADRLAAAGDTESAEILRVIHREEIGHVAAGVRWFEALCAARKLEPVLEFGRLVAERLAGGPKEPFNIAARDAAGLIRPYYKTASQG